MGKFIHSLAAAGLEGPPGQCHTFRMRRLRKHVSVSLPGELLEAIDSAARELRETRSALMEEWLRLGARARRQDTLDDEVEAYYRERTESERREDEELAKASAGFARALDYDGQTSRLPSRR